MKELLSKPNDYYFHVGIVHTDEWNDELNDFAIEVLVVITPVEFFDKNGCVFDRHLKIDSILPAGIVDTCESLYESKHSFEETERLLLAAGFKQSPEFSDSCKNHDPF